MWTGIADVTSGHLPENVQGALYRVLTFAESQAEFHEKVRRALLESGDTLQYMEDVELVSELFVREQPGSDHEIHEMIETSDKSREDVVCGEIVFYTRSDG